jgi:hypothetical protein
VVSPQSMPDQGNAQPHQGKSDRPPVTVTQANSDRSTSIAQAITVYMAWKLTGLLTP